MKLSGDDISTLRELAASYMEIAELPVMREKIELWKALNRSKMQRPMVCIDQLPWDELSADETLQCRIADPYWRNVEWELRATIYKWRHFPVDMVVEPFITIPKVIGNSGYGLGAECDVLRLTEETTAPSRLYKQVLTGFEDIGRIQDMRISVDAAKTREVWEQAQHIFAGAAQLMQGHGIQFHLGVWDYLTEVMGVENAYIDFMDRPDFLHACMDRITGAAIAGIEQANALGVHDDISNRCHCSYVYTDELLPGCGEGKGPVSQNSWAFGLAQLFTSVSPRMMEEFEIPYISRMAEYFGMIYYGCCDRLDDRLDIVKTIPHVRKVSCSPWSDRKRFAEAIGTELIMSNKPTPAFVAEKSVNWDAVEADLRLTVELAKANNVNLEMILKDISTVANQPDRLTRWADIAMKVVGA
ncbi:MAG: hypothetical protein JW811_06340 [Clostridiales bacterium]|nr:hypothetical protein [Clostridiales bacterium]